VPDSPERARQRAAGREAFRAWITADGAGRFPAEGGGRYHLYVSYACPWAHRTILYRALKGLEQTVGMSVLHPRMGTPDGWTFTDSEGSTIDRAGGRRYLHEVYAAACSDYTGKVTVPVLWDRHQRTIVNNESGEIIRMLNSEFDGVGGDRTVDYYPPALRPEIDSLNAWLLPDICSGVYAAGFAADQDRYDAAVARLFAGLDRLEDLLSDGRPFLLGDTLCEPDWHLFTTALRFDAAYYSALRCDIRRYADYPRLSAHLRRMTAHPGVAATIRLDHIKRHYYDWIGERNPTIVSVRKQEEMRDRPRFP
ncbi:MAG TPA: glutathione S-transferase C-terminal domain-containing protein, partial [Arenicellales bacterium]|nr:glutathione S-transferase C-terminal domain-containing protein [Arenicellales bacterium]